MIKKIHNKVSRFQGVFDLEDENRREIFKLKQNAKGESPT